MQADDENPFGALLERLGKRGHGEGECTRQHYDQMPDSEAVKLLNIAVGILNTPVTIKPGDIVRGKKELVESHIRNWEKPHILIRFLDRPIALQHSSENVGNCTASATYDCEIGSFHERGFVRHLADSREWEVHPNAAKLKGKADA